ncbi:DUF397 domain-containing protein [Nocardiopsis tropica]|uniref:DUF397 domain-containing protein n=1 Tax=Nocardiopsis tropica TaxID=109330 RepID=A0ABU7KMY6_9ACTN|nr:DUF397 domain-containing protein [Nocardiopsis umidischolae]MEE2050649.1 DUF397 domain-containing protein [Nocardiopsis umidischolae]
MSHDDYSWHKSSYSGARGDCVEVAEGVTVRVRDTQNRPLGYLAIPANEWNSLVSTLRTSV